VSRCEKLLELARRNPAGLRFTELCLLAECHGWTFEHQRGSHVKLTMPGHDPLTYQAGKNGSAKRYQVVQLLKAIQNMRSEEEE